MSTLFRWTVVAALLLAHGASARAVSTLFRLAVVAVLVLAHGTAARADGRRTLAREAVEYAAKRLGWKVAKEVMEATAKRLETESVRHGDDLIHAFRKAGTQSFDVAEKHGASGLRLVARHGDGAVVHVLAKPKALALATRLGDDAAEAMVKHPKIAEGVLEQFGAPAAKAFTALDARNGRRLAMMAGEGGSLSKIGRADELLGVVGKRGNRAMEFVWNHKVELTAAAALAAFLADPDPFIDGVRDLSKVAAESAVRPVAEAVGKGLEKSVEAAAPEVARKTNWTVVISAAVLGPVGVAGMWVWGRAKRPILLEVAGA